MVRRRPEFDSLRKLQQHRRSMDPTGEVLGKRARRPATIASRYGPFDSGLVYLVTVKRTISVGNGKQPPEAAVPVVRRVRADRCHRSRLE